LIHWLLTELEKHPSRLFRESELTNREVGQDARLKKEGLLIYEQPNEHEEKLWLNGNYLTVVNIRGERFGVNEEDPEADPIPLSRGDLARYRFSVEHFIQKLAEANGFSGKPERLHGRLYYAGEYITDDNKTIAIALALFDQEKNAEDLLLGLPSRLPGYDHWMAVTPSFEVRRPALRAQLEGLHIHVVPLEDAENLKVDMSMFAEKESHPEPTVVLTAKQQKEFDDRGYKCNLQMA